MSDYIVASCKEWHRTAFEKFIYDNKFNTKNWHYVSDDVSLENCTYDFPPRYIFFLHWNWIVPETIFTKFECVCFHMTDLPYGRGGSPLQNLILEGKKIPRSLSLE